MPVSYLEQYNDPVRVSIPGLIALSQYSRSLSLKSNRVIAAQGGNYYSSFKGRGMEYDESRLYQSGDDIRNLDWRVTARTGKAHTKLFREERERPVFICTDYRAPMFFATRGKYKSVIATEIASLLAWSAVQNGDRIGGMIFSEHIQHEFKTGRGKSAALYFISQLARHPAWKNNREAEQNEQSGEEALSNLSRAVRPGSLIFLLSDFRYFNRRARSHLVNLSRHNEIVMIFIYDLFERQLPLAGQYRLRQGQREIEIDTHNERYRKEYREQFDNRRIYLMNLVNSTSIRFLECSTQDDPCLILKKGVYSR